MRLTRVSVEQQKSSWDPKKVLARSNVFKVILEESQKIHYFACNNATQRDSIVATIENYLLQKANNPGKETVLLGYV